MCRWLAYIGSPVLLEEALYKPKHSLIDQSLHSQLGAEPTNGDGFGVGWYDGEDHPGVFRSIEPAWNDRNLRELAEHVRSPLFFAHVRASIGSSVQQTNCHPFRHGRWLWMHNGFVDGFAQVKRDLVLAIDPSLYPSLEGQTDSEILFLIALSLGLDDGPPDAVARTIGLVEETGRRHGVEHPFQGTIAASDGERLWAFRYSSIGKSRSLFFTRNVDTLRHLDPDREILQELSADARLVVSEPIGELPGAWNEVPESSFGVVGKGEASLEPFHLKPPTSSVGAGARA
jgi:predicted glutamine amidotransferase